MAIAVPTEVPVAVAIFIMLPYFVATIATIIYTNRKTRKSNYNENDNYSKDTIVDNNND
jgi:hypothetical protein